MSKSIHIAYLATISVLVALLFVIGQQPPENTDEPTKPIILVVFPFQSPPKYEAFALSFTDALTDSLASDQSVTVVPVAKILPSEFSAENYLKLKTSIENQLVFRGFISGADENLRIGGQLSRGLDSKPLWTDDYVTNVYDIDAASAELMKQLHGQIGR